MNTLKRMMVALLALLPLATGMAVADNDHGYSRIFIFGASFMDSGNHFTVTGETAHPPFEYISFASYGVGGHRPTNGHTWVEVLAQDMNLTEWGKPAWRNPAFGNYAFSFGRARDVLPDPMEASLSDQVQAWINNGFCTGSPENPMHDTLFIMDSAYADFLDILFNGEDALEVLGGMADSIATNIGILHECGAHNLLFAYTVPAGSFPVTPEEAKDDTNFLSWVYNFMYLQPIIGFYSSDMNISTVDFFALVSGIMFEPAAFGFTNVTDACVTPYVTDGAFCKDRDDYLFWDVLHPTKTGHAVFANFALGQLPVPD